jgi:hypothetical protein
MGIRSCSGPSKREAFGPPMIDCVVFDIEVVRVYRNSKYILVLLSIQQMTGLVCVTSVLV